MRVVQATPAVTYKPRLDSELLRAQARIWDPGGESDENDACEYAARDAAQYAKEVRILIDTGANINVMSLRCARVLGLRIRPSKSKVKMGKGSALATGRVQARATIAGHSFTASYVVIDGLNEDFILGLTTMKRERAIINCAAGRVVFLGQSWKDMPQCTMIEADEVGEQRLFTLTDEDNGVMDWDEWELFTVVVGDSKPEGTVDPSMVDVIEQYKDTVFSTLSELPPRRGDWDFRIELLNRAQPSKISHYRLSAREKDAVLKEITKMRALGWFVPSKSAWSSPILFAKNTRKDGSLRAVYDYRALNAQTVRCAYPVPRIDDLLERLSGATRFTTIDIAKAFNQIRNAEDSQELSAISTPFGLWESRVMMLGMKNSGPQFQAFIDAVIRGDAEALPRFEADHPRYQEGERRLQRYLPLSGKPEAVFEDLSSICAVYIDDLVVYTSDPEQHRVDVIKIITRLHEFGLKANQFFKVGATEIEFIGFHIAEGAIRPLAAKTQAIADWPVCRNAHDVRSFLGVVQYYRGSIPQLANFGAILSRLTSKKVEWSWTEREHAAFLEIKKRLVEATARAMPRLDQPFIVVTDASIYGIGGVLLQVFEQEVKPIEFFSRQTTDVEAGRNGSAGYHQYELELMGVENCVRHWRHYLDGARVIIYTDHETLVTGGVLSKHSTHNFNPRVLRWIEYLMPFDIELRHHSASRPLAHLADAFSRRPDFYPTKDLVHLDAELKDDIRGRVGKINLIEGDATASIMHNELQAVKDALALKNKSELELAGMEERDGLWFRRNRLFIPPELAPLRRRIIESIHAVGHRGINATEKLVRMHFDWPNLQQEVREVVSACEVCARTKPRLTQKKMPLLPLPVPEQRWQEVELDFIVGLPESGEAGYTSIATVTDRLTKEVMLIPTWDTVKASEFAMSFITHVWRRKGLPAKIITDRDPKFMSAFWKHLLERLKISSATAAPYHHESIGQAEKANQTVEGVLRTMIDKATHNDWAHCLPVAEFAINSTPAASTGLSPFQATLGFQPRAGLVHEWWPSAQGEQDATFAKRMAEVLEQVKDAMRRAQERQVRSHGGVEPPAYRVGQLVYLSSENVNQRNVGPALKLQDRWLGPFRIEEMLNSRTVKLFLPQGCTIDNKIHISRIKPAPEDGTAPDVVIDEDGDEAGMYEAEKIVDHTTKGRGNKKTIAKVQVRWRGYAPAFDTWETIENMMNGAEALVREYAKRQRVLLPVREPVATAPADRREGRTTRAATRADRREGRATRASARRQHVNLVQGGVLRIDHHQGLRCFAPNLAQKYARGREQAYVEEFSGATTRQPGTTGVIVDRGPEAMAGKRVFAQPALREIGSCMDDIIVAQRMDPTTHVYVVVPRWPEESWWSKTKAFAIARALPRGGVYYERYEKGKWVRDEPSPWGVLVLRTTSPEG